MDANVREAAERLRGIEGPTIHAVEGRRMIREREYADAVTLARDWLRLNPADDGEPLDEAFLQSAGFDSADSFTHDLYPICMELFAGRSGEAIIGGVIFPHMDTRGDLRRLFAGLKLHLPEPT